MWICAHCAAIKAYRAKWEKSAPEMIKTEIMRLQERIDILSSIPATDQHTRGYIRGCVYYHAGKGGEL